MQPKQQRKLISPRNLIHDRVRQARLTSQPRVSQEDLSARVEAYGVVLSQESISKIESGTRIVTDIELKAIASALAVSIAWLVDEEETFRGTFGAPNKRAT